MFYYDKDKAVDSSSIDHVYYNSNTYELVVKFRNGNSAGYRKVGNDTYDKFINAESVGQYYNWTIKGIHPGFRVDAVSALAKPEVAVVERDRGVVDKPKFKVTAEVTGGVTLEVHADDFVGALAAAQSQIEKAFGASDVTVNFKGVNVV